MLNPPPSTPAVSPSSTLHYLCSEYLTIQQSPHPISTSSLLPLLTSLSNILSSCHPQTQTDFYKELTARGINCLLHDITTSSNIQVRKLSTKILISTLYNNEHLQNNFCDNFNFTPVTNIIVLNWLPKIMKQTITINENVLNQIKNDLITPPNNKFKFWMWPYNEKYNDDNYPDPLKYIIGFYYTTHSVFDIEKKENVDVDMNDIINKLEDGKDEDNQYLSSLNIIKENIKNNSGHTSTANTINSNITPACVKKKKKYLSKSIECKGSTINNSGYHKQVVIPSYINNYKHSLVYNNNNHNDKLMSSAINTYTQKTTIKVKK